ncbi:hypothetical protein V3C99_001849 [Haemonchus contortus]
MMDSAVVQIALNFAALFAARSENRTNRHTPGQAGSQKCKGKEHGPRKGQVRVRVPSETEVLSINRQPCGTSDPPKSLLLLRVYRNSELRLFHSTLNDAGCTLILLEQSPDL